MNALTANGQAGTYPASYYASTVDFPPERSAVHGAHECDVCIVGGGFTGLSSALHLAERGYNVTVLEANRAGWGASGRNGGQIGSGQRLEQSALEDMFGLERARQLWELGEAAKAKVQALMAAHGIAADYRPGIVHADHKSRYVAQTNAEVDLLRTRYSYDQLEVLSKQEIGQQLGTTAYFGGVIDRGAGHLNPLKLCLGLAAAAERAGATICEHTTVHGITRTGGGTVKVSARVEHGERAEISADQVVLAGNGYLSGLAPQIERRFMPINNYILVTEPLGAAGAQELIARNMAVADSRFVINYFRCTPDHRLLFGGGETYRLRFPKDIARIARRPMLEIYPQLAGTAIDYAWGGTLAITRSRLPHFSKVAPGVLSAGGYSGHGVGLATLAGEIIADAVAGTMERFDLMAELPTPAFPGGTLLRWPGLVLGMTWFALRDRL